MVSISTFAAAACALLALAGTAYCVLSIWAALRYLAEAAAPSQPVFTPPVSILKSLKGVDEHMYEALRSHCLLDYPGYEIIFGVHGPDEPALPLVRRLQQEFPQLSLRILVCPAVLGANGKVSNLAQMLPHAQHEHIIVNDSDIVVSRDYLQRVLAPFTQPGVGMVTTLYRGIAGTTLGSRLEALGLNTDFVGGVLLARAMEGGIRFGLGATIVTTKLVLRQIGGFEPIADCLGDDYELGARAAAAGYRVELARTIVETVLPNYTFREFWWHQMRWARNVKDRRPSQYFGVIATFGLPWAILGALARPFVWWTWLILAMGATARFASAMVVGEGVLGDRPRVRDLCLLPLRDCIALAIWVTSYWGNTVVWRGLRFRLKGGKLEPM